MSNDQTKSNSAVPRGSLRSKPASWERVRVFHDAGFFCGAKRPAFTGVARDGQARCGYVATGYWGG